MSIEPSTPLNDADHAGSFDYYGKNCAVKNALIKNDKKD